MTGEKERQLRQTIDPYLGLGFVFLLVTLLVGFVAISQRQLEMLEAVPIMWLPFGYLIYTGRKYRVFWTDEWVRMKVSPKGEVCLLFTNVRSVAEETSITRGRPFRRIALYGGDSGDSSKTVDISLKHFSAHGIRQLLQSLHMNRPDLVIPKRWLKA